METNANYVAVGAFVLTSILVLVISLMWLAGAQYSHEYAYYRTNFRGAVTGLGKGTTVRYNGIDVGRVEDLQFDPNDPQVVIVSLQVQPGLNIRTDSVSSIEPQGLTGGSYVEISGGTKDAPLLTTAPGEKYGVIKAAPSALQQLTAGAPQLLGKLNLIAERLANLLSDDNQKHIANTLANLDKTTAMLAGNSGEIDSMLASLAQASRQLPQTVADIDGAANKVSRLADNADALVSNEGLAQLPALVSDTRRTMQNLNRLTQQLDRQPTKLIFGDRRKGYTPP